MTLRPQFSLGVTCGDNRIAPTHTAQGCGRMAAQFPCLRGDQIADLMVFEMAPHVFDGIEFRCICRQTLHPQLAFSGSHVVPHKCAAMNWCTVPNQQDFSTDMTPEMPEKFDDLGSLDTASVDLEIKLPQSQPSNNRKAFPVECFLKNRGLAFGCPCAHASRSGAQAAFVDEDDGSAFFAGFFFSQGHLTRIQWRTSFSSRSSARRSGRWQLNPAASNNFQTCPG